MAAKAGPCVLLGTSSSCPRNSSVALEHQGGVWEQVALKPAAALLCRLGSRILDISEGYVTALKTEHDGDVGEQDKGYKWIVG